MTQNTRPYPGVCVRYPGSKPTIERVPVTDATAARLAEIGPTVAQAASAILERETADPLARFSEGELRAALEKRAKGRE